jgi:hypothetical protein
MSLIRLDVRRRLSLFLRIASLVLLVASGAMALRSIGNVDEWAYTGYRKVAFTSAGLYLQISVLHLYEGTWSESRPVPFASGAFTSPVFTGGEVGFGGRDWTYAPVVPSSLFGAWMPDPISPYFLRERNLSRVPDAFAPVVTHSVFGSTLAIPYGLLIIAGLVVPGIEAVRRWRQRSGVVRSGGWPFPWNGRPHPNGSMFPRFMGIIAVMGLMFLLGFAVAAEFGEFGLRNPLGFVRTMPGGLHFEYRANEPGWHVVWNAWHVPYAGSELPPIGLYLVPPDFSLGPVKSIRLPWWLLILTWALLTAIVWRMPRWRAKQGFPVELAAKAK